MIPLPSENLRIKSDLMSGQRLAGRRFPFRVALTIHQIPFCFHVEDEAVIKELYDSYPLAWFQDGGPNPIQVFWHDSRGLGFEDAAWESESSFECYVARDGKNETAVHRDFAARFDGENVNLVCPYTIQDGFYNFLRWLAPIKFVGQNKLLLHSSCVIDQNKNAYFSLGPSGAGKTTIASLRPRKKILGDDMNVVKIEDGRCWAQAGALGQALLNPAEYSNWYPVKAFLWLEKSTKLEIRELSRAAQVKRLATAVANVFWDNLSEEQALAIFTSINEILKINRMYELAFPIERDVWDFVFQTFKEDL